MQTQASQTKRRHDPNKEWNQLSVEQTTKEVVTSANHHHRRKPSSTHTPSRHHLGISSTPPPNSTKISFLSGKVVYTWAQRSILLCKPWTTYSKMQKHGLLYYRTAFLTKDRCQTRFSCFSCSALPSNLVDYNWSICFGRSQSYVFPYYSCPCVNQVIK